LLANLKKLVAFGKEVISEPKGTGSNSRVVALLCALGAFLSLLGYLIYKHDLPTGDQLKGLAEFVGGGSVGYGANKVAAAINKPDDPDAGIS